LVVSGHAVKGDTITVTVTPNDGLTNGASATATTTVQNTAPVASDGSVTLSHRLGGSITLAATDADGDPLTYSGESAPSNGTVLGSGSVVVYHPSAPATNPGSDSFTFSVSDGTATSNTATESITLTNAAPVITSLTLSPSSPQIATTLTANTS